MRSLLSILIILVTGLQVRAQDTAPNKSVPDLKYPHRKHCITTRIGEGVMLGGGSLVALSTIGYLADRSSHHGDIDKGGAGMFFVAFGALGANVALDGLVVFIIGKVYEKHHSERFSLVGGKNSVGIAWNF